MDKTKFIPYGKQNLDKLDIDAVLQVLKSDFLTQGPVVPLFEEAVCGETTARYAIAVNSATSALHIAYLALGVRSGDTVWTSPNTFVATANAALFCGAGIDFVDIGQDGNMCMDALEEKLSRSKNNGTLPNVVTPVHFAGKPCDMKRLKHLSTIYGFKILEDASHAIGSDIDNSPTGSCQYSEICVFSFHPVKVITSGEGGMATTNSEELFKKMTLFRNHGITRDPHLFEQNNDGDWYYEQIELGWNYRMTDIHAALGMSQVKKLNRFITLRKQLVAAYSEKLADTDISLPCDTPGVNSAWHLFVVKLESAAERKSVFNFLRHSNIGVNVHYIPLHLQPYYQRLGFKLGDFPSAEMHYNSSISLPMFPTLTIEQLTYVSQLIIDGIRNIRS